MRNLLVVREAATSETRRLVNGIVVYQHVIDLDQQCLVEANYMAWH